MQNGLILLHNVGHSLLIRKVAPLSTDAVARSVSNSSRFLLHMQLYKLEVGSVVQENSEIRLPVPVRTISMSSVQTGGGGAEFDDQSGVVTSLDRHVSTKECVQAADSSKLTLRVGFTRAE